MKARWRKFVRNTYRSLRRPRYRPRRRGVRYWLAHRVFPRELWKPSQRTFALGLALGLAVAMLPPIPVQMLLATFLAMLCRGNIPVAAAAVWVSNPATWYSIITFQRDLGRRLLPQLEVYDQGLKISLESVRSIAMGVVVTAVLVGLVSFALSYLTWGWIASVRETRREARDGTGRPRMGRPPEEAPDRERV